MRGWLANSSHGVGVMISSIFVFTTNNLRLVFLVVVCQYLEIYNCCCYFLCTGLWISYRKVLHSTSEIILIMTFAPTESPSSPRMHNNYSPYPLPLNTEVYHCLIFYVIVTAAHRNCFIGFIVCSIAHMLLFLFLFRSVRYPPTYRVRFTGPLSSSSSSS